MTKPVNNITWNSSVVDRLLQALITAGAQLEEEALSPHTFMSRLLLLSEFYYDISIIPLLKQLAGVAFHQLSGHYLWPIYAYI